ncbi:CBS domain-containing protein [Paracoccus pantotrophus]|uniref:CBS domain-containing protein n=1 Tax=Paracoccus pantotrophus TaxID=82367 RepID=UPI0035B4F8EA
MQDEFRQLTKDLGKSAVFITHDLDEAIRIGDRIAIMKDGVIIQTGTAEEIILNPADDYVADFVAGISRLHLIKAHSVMQLVTRFEAENPGQDVSSFAHTHPEADIDELIDLTLQHRAAGLAVRDGGELVGIVTPADLLLGVKGSQSPAQTHG